MKRIGFLIISIVLVVMLMASITIMSVDAASSISYTFSGSDKSTPGYAEGTVKITGDSGAKYYLYWGDNNGALSGYSYITSITASGTTASYTFKEHVAIPKDARYLLAFQSTGVPANTSYASATVRYTIPNSKRIGDSKSYTFAAFSDVHMDEPGNNYPYDEQHLQNAFDVAAKRDVDFVITSGDNINNQCYDNGGKRYNMYWTYELATYQKILADSDYVNPVYEAIGNHELWNGDTDSSPKTNQGGQTQSNYFIGATGLNGNTSAISSGKAYYEVTEPNTGDHFIFLALEGGFYPDRVEEFSAAQLTWLEGRLKAYQNDGKNVYIIEHANFYKWGAGDLLDNPLYDIPLKPSVSSTAKLETILKTYKNAVVITGHTHFQFSDVPNISDNGATSAYIIHNSSVGGVRIIQNNARVNKHNVLSMTQGYLVDVYGNSRIFNGTDLYNNLILPEYSYIVGKSSAYTPTQPTETIAPTETVKPTESVGPTEIEPTETEPIETEVPTETEPVIIYGDADCNGVVNIIDTTKVQQHLAKLVMLTGEGRKNAMVADGVNLTVADATYIQLWLSNKIDIFPVEKEMIAQTGSAVSDEISEYLKTQYIYSSYDQYQACKKALKGYFDGSVKESVLKVKYVALQSIVNKYGKVGTTTDIYFSDSLNWGTINAYAWNKASGASVSAWPGQKMTYVKTNSLNQKIYKITVPTGAYDYIIFSNASGTQTLDLKIPYMINPQFYPTGNSSGKYYCGVTSYEYTLNK